MSGISTNIVKSDRGIALLLAVTIISLLMAITLEFNKNMRQELVSSANLKDGSQLNAMVKSGYNIAELVLLKDKNNNVFDSYNDDWAKLASTNFSSLFGRAQLRLEVLDLSGKLQLNSFANTSGQAGAASVADESRNILRRMLLSGDFGDLSLEQANLIVDAITDWVDADDQEIGIEETESSYYYSLDPSYACKNGPLEFIEELLLIRGVTRQLFYGTAEFKGLRNFVTVHGSDGKININSAPAEVLLAMNDAMSIELAEKMIAYRQDEENKDLLQNASWYSNITPWPSDIALDSKIVTTVSSYFEVLATGKNAEMEKTLCTVVKRESGDTVSVITRKVE